MSRLGLCIWLGLGSGSGLGVGLGLGLVFKGCENSTRYEHIKYIHCVFIHMHRQTD
jgi:hypothetical protein